MFKRDTQEQISLESSGLDCVRTQVHKSIYGLQKHTPCPLAQGCTSAPSGIACRVSEDSHNWGSLCAGLAYSSHPQESWQPSPGWGLYSRCSLLIK